MSAYLETADQWKIERDKLNELIADFDEAHVLLADDQALLLIDSDPDQEVVGEATDGAEAIALARARRLDVVVMDIRMPGADGLAATATICANQDLADTHVLIFTTFEIDECVAQALRARAAVGDEEVVGSAQDGQRRQALHGPVQRADQRVCRIEFTGVQTAGFGDSGAGEHRIERLDVRLVGVAGRDVVP
ncbi:Response regulator receiver domain-containing protein [Streptomyces sp. Termitarium-T10T-6]|nr:Response regulator receiver domain-containing protein [Streptomyces sp. Termitarium-T10T-6]